MDLRPLDFESSASTNFTTPPWVVRPCSETFEAQWIIGSSVSVVKGLSAAWSVHRTNSTA